jgi:hypothetical protein
MASFNYDEGTILRFRGTDRKNVHMGFVVDETRVMELIDIDGICNICLTDINKTHPLTGKNPYREWSRHESPPRGWSLQENVERIAKAHEEFHGSEYNKIHNNCQHFAYKAVYGYRRSPDVEKYPSWLVDSGIVEFFAGASEASSESSAALVQEYAKDAITLIQTLQKAAKLANLPLSSSNALENFSGIIDSADSLRNLFGK